MVKNMKKLTQSHYLVRWESDLFPTGGGEGRLKILAVQGLQKIADIYSPDEKHLMSFDEIVVQQNIARNQFFRYLQLRDLDLEHTHKKNPFWTYINTWRNDGERLPGKGFDFKNIYNKLVDQSSETSANRLESWREDPQENLSTEEGEGLYQSTITNSEHTF